MEKKRRVVVMKGNFMFYFSVELMRVCGVYMELKGVSEFVE
jgi:hypothetical protein